MPGHLKIKAPSDQSAHKTQYSRAKFSDHLVYSLHLRVASVKELMVELVPDSTKTFPKAQKTRVNQFKVKDYLQPQG